MSIRRFARSGAALTRLMRSLWRDLAFGVRMMARRPGFTAAALLSLVLGIGLNTAVFTLLDAIFLRPLPVEDLDSLAAVYATVRDDAGEYGGHYGVSHANYLDLRSRSRSFSGLALHVRHRMNLSGGSEPVRGTGMFVTANYFEVLGITPHTGRFFEPGEDATPGSHPVAVLSHGCWSRQFGAASRALGETIEVNGHKLTVVGVAPKGFKGTEIGVDVDVWLPAMMFEQISPYGVWFDQRGISIFSALGRLETGVTPEQAGEELMHLARQLEAEFPADNERMGARVLPLLEGTIRPSERSRHLTHGTGLLMAALLILLMSCFNVAGLLLVRGLERGREIAVRQAVGAGRRRLVRQLMSENLVLFVAAGVLSLPVARFGLELLWRFRPPQFAEDALTLELDAWVFGLAFATALASGLVFGLLPALEVARLDLVSRLKAAAASEGPAAPGRRRLRPRRLVVVAQVALALIALIGSGLFLSSLDHARRVDVGFAADSLLALSFAPGEQGWDETRTRAFYDRVLERVESLPGVRAATLSENRLLRGGIIQLPIYLEGHREPFLGSARPSHRTNAVFPGFFAAAGIPLVRGRDFDTSIRAGGPRVAIVNQTMADLAWPGEDPIGQRFRFGPQEPPMAVLGVARDHKYRYVHEAPQFFVYLPEIQRHAPAMTLHVRAEGDPAALLATVRDQVHTLDSALPLADVRTLSEFVDEALWIERAAATLLSIFGALALALATLGVYSVVAESVSQRRRELGVRVAVGAGPADLLRVVVIDGLKTVAAGVATGLAAALAIARLGAGVSSQLHGVSVTDPAIYAAAALALSAAALLGLLVPAIRAMRTDPVRALRSE